MSPDVNRTPVLAIIFDFFGVIQPLGQAGKDAQILELAKQLHANYKTAVLSNVGRGGLDAYFAQDKSAIYFDALLASGDIGYDKPDIRAYQIAADRLGVTPGQCLMIDDRTDCVNGAIRAGMQAISYGSFVDLQSELQRQAIL